MPTPMTKPHRGPSGPITRLVVPSAVALSIATPARPAKPATTKPTPSTPPKTAATKTQSRRERDKSVTIDSDRAIRGKAFMDTFGPQGAVWFAQGLTFAESQARFDQQRTEAQERRARRFNLGAIGRIANGMKIIRK